GVQDCLANAAIPVWLSASVQCLGTPISPRLSARGMDFAARYLAHAYLCQRFAYALTDAHA
ncbi:hypothetical protein, partial [Paraburkholderia mimosarum]|uniref:hypothetical protein n=1 Tax=Paraburkholderia mimosarum TaxID=312026 RepID=UPI001ADF736E